MASEASAAFDWVFKASDVAIVVATLLGPVLAVQAQKWLERSREIKTRQVNVFKTLMMTRASTLSPAHVQALNSVPIEFYGKSATLKEVIECWKLLLDHFGQDVSATAWEDRRQTLLIEMLHAMAAHLGYDFSKVEIKNEIYAPRGHFVVESDQEIIRRGLAAILSGQFALPMDVKSFPIDPAVSKEQEELRRLLLQWMKGDGAVAVQIRPADGGASEKPKT